MLAVEEAGERDGKVIAGANISVVIQKALMKGIKSISQQLFERTGEEDEGIMVIGYPTDVQHVAHVGPDGSSAAALFCLPPISLAQFQHANS
ncbi:hypothetical protein KSP40_PGU003372 [Platanthera guangdongensis]|uniref:CRIB domain-containing protein n=1 Tax=Platanthera guangdongensis TaxID=2320717 RepID=A0ABR2LMK7_9ASPA